MLALGMLVYELTAVPKRIVSTLAVAGVGFSETCGFFSSQAKKSTETATVDKRMGRVFPEVIFLSSVPV